MVGKRAERLQVMLTHDEVRAVEEWRFRQMMPSRSAAVRALMKRGLDHRIGADERDAVLEGRMSSGDIGVVGGSDGDAEPAGLQPRVDVLVHAGDLLAARGLASIAEAGGFAVLGHAGSTDATLELLERRPHAVVVLDLRDGRPQDVKLAKTLAERRSRLLLVVADRDGRTGAAGLSGVPALPLARVEDELAGRLAELGRAAEAADEAPGAPSAAG